MKQVASCLDPPGGIYFILSYYYSFPSFHSKWWLLPHEDDIAALVTLVGATLWVTETILAHEPAGFNSRIFAIAIHWVPHAGTKSCGLQWWVCANKTDDGSLRCMKLCG